MCTRIQRTTTLLFTLLTLAGLPAPGAATSRDEAFGLLLQSASGVEPAPVLGQMIEVRVTGIVARARVTQVFSNPTEKQVEATYVFPLPETAAVDTLRMVIGDQRIEGRIQAKEEAAATYRQAAAEGRKAVLLEQQRPDVFTASVTRIGPGETVEVEIEMQFDVTYDLGTFRLRFPMVVAPRYEAKAASANPEAYRPPPLLLPPITGEEVNPTALRVEVEAGFPTARVESRTHRVRVDEHPGDRFTVELADEVAPADRDFVLEWTPQPGKAPRIASFVQEKDGERYVLLMVVPPPPEALASVRLPREAVFVIDVSGSMDGGKIAQARRALLSALGQLQPGDRVNVIRFDDKTKALFGASRPVDSATLGEARRFVRALESAGGTEMMPALKKALEDPDPASKELRQVVFVTDGHVGNEAVLFDYIEKHLGRSRLFTVGIGSAPNADFMRRASKYGRGTFTFIDETSDVAGAMVDLLRKLDAPVVKDVRVVWDDPTVESWPERVPDLYLGEPLVVSGRLHTSGRLHGDSGVHVSGWQREKHLEVTLPLTATRPVSGLDKLWARRKVDALEAERQEGADAAEIRRQIVEVGLEHHLVTDFTSLVSVDVLPSVPAEETPQSHLMPVNPPADQRYVDQRYAGQHHTGYVDVDDSLEETITVTSESPLLDARKVTTGATVSQVELEKIPSARDPWALVESVPGAVTDRVNVGGNASSPPTAAVGPGSTGSENLWGVDGVVVTDMKSVVASPALYNFDAFEEAEVSTGGGDATLSYGGVTLNMVTKRGTNEWRGSGRYARTDDFGTTDDPSADGRDRVEEGEDHGATASGPAVRDRLWVMGSYSRHGAHRTALDGDPASTLLDGASGKLNAQLSTNDSVVAGWNRGDADLRGLDVGPERSPEAAVAAVAEAETWSLEETHVFSSSFFMRALVATHDRGEQTRSTGTGAPLWDESGVLGRGGRGSDRALQQWQARIDATAFFNLGGTSHELKLGAERRDVRESETHVWPGDRDGLHVAGANFGVAGDFFRLEGPGTTVSGRIADGVWAQDTWTWRDLVVNTGLRYDRQQGSLFAADTSAVDWQTLVPRLAAALPIGAERRTLVRGSWARFAQRLARDLVVRPDPAAVGEALFRFTDTDGDGLWQEDEDAVLLAADGLVRPHVNEPGLDPALTDEWVLGVEHAFRPELVLSLSFTHRRQSDVHEVRDLVVDPVSGEARPVLAGDYVLDHVATGTLPGGAPYSVPVYSLRSGVLDAGAGLLVNGDRALEHDGVALTLNKRLSYHWMARGHVHYGRQRWRLGPRWALHHDPTNLLGSGDDHGALYLEAPADVDLSTSPWLQRTWSAYLNTLVRLFPQRSWGFDLALALHARQGNPLPYFAWDLASADGLPRRLQVPDDVESFRLEDVLTFDLRLEKEVTLVGDLEAIWTLDALNVFDEDAALRRELNLSGPRGGDLAQTVASRTFRLGLLLRWN